MRTIPILLSILLSVTLGCADDTAVPPDASGSDASRDVNQPDGSPDVGADASTDAAIQDVATDTTDASRPAGSRVTFFLSTGIASAIAVDREGNPLTITTGTALDQAIRFVVGDQVYSFDTATNELHSPIPTYDTDGMTTITADIMFSGRLAGATRVFGVFGSELRVFDAVMDPARFSQPQTLYDLSSVALVPPGAAVTRLNGSSAIMLLSADGEDLLLDGSNGDFTFETAIPNRLCSDVSTIIAAEHLTMVVPPGQSGDPSISVSTGSMLYPFDPAGLCLLTPVSLEDAGGTALMPRALFGANLDNSPDGSEEVLIVVEDP